ncbi:MAG: hybrid sensor histidine kinase/response regulator [Pseudomonadales bacterium]
MSEIAMIKATDNDAFVKKLNVLLVDDHEGDRLLCRKHMDRSKEFVCNFTEARSTTEALELVSQQQFDCVLLDNYLPDGVGVEVINNLRVAAQDDLLAVILLTGRGDESIAVDAMQHGANDYLPKNKLSVTVLERTIGNCIEKTSLKRMVERKRQMLDQTNSELQQRNLEIREFYQTVSHELKTPVTAIREYNSLMLEGVGGDVSDTQKDFLSRSVACCDRLTRLINDLLDAARLETGKMCLEIAPVNLFDILEESVLELLPVAEENEINLRHISASVLPTCTLDPDRIIQIVTNLVTNAIKNTEAGGEVTVGAMADTANQQVAISVTDNGCGISEEDQQLIFERYFQCKPEEGDFKEGMGIGLYLCSKLAALHGGHLELQSELGSGSTFTVVLPINGGQDG